MTLDEALADVTTVGFDTSPIIYLIETHPEYDELVTEIFRRIDQGISTGFTSAITLTEVLTQPLKQGQIHLIAICYFIAPISIRCPSMQRLPSKPQVFVWVTHA